MAESISSKSKNMTRKEFREQMRLENLEKQRLRQLQAQERFLSKRKKKEEARLKRLKMVDELLTTIQNENYSFDDEETKSIDDVTYNMNYFTLNYINGEPVIDEDCEKLNKYEVKTDLGKGAYGSIKLLCYKDNCNYVLKIQNNNQYFKDEVQAHYELQTTNCVPKIFDAWTCNDKGYFVIELLSTNVDLDNMSFLRQLNHCVKTIHNNGWRHLDLKSDNILFNDKTGKLVLSDLGMAIKQNNDPDKIYDKLEGQVLSGSPDLEPVVNMNWYNSEIFDLNAIKNIMEYRLIDEARAIKKLTKKKKHKTSKSKKHKTSKSKKHKTRKSKKHKSSKSKKHKNKTSKSKTSKNKTSKN